MALSTISGTTGITDATITSAKLADFAAAVDLNGVELILDADQDTSITADTDDRIDFKIAGVEHFSFSNSSGDTIVKPMVDAKDIKLQQFDGRTLLDINDAGFVGIENGATGPGAIRIFEDSDLGSNYVGLSVGNVSTAYTLVFPNADGSSGQALTTNGSGVLSFTTISSAADDLTAGDAAVTLTTSSGNITIDAAANDSDIIFKGTDGGADKTFATFDGSAGGDLFLNGGLIDLKNDGSNVSQIKFYCESSNAHAQTLIGAPHAQAADNTLTLPDGADGVLLSTTSTATVTNKTLTSPVINTGTFGTSILPTSADGTTLGSASKEFSDLFLADSSTIQFGNDQDTTLTHTDGAGLTLNSTNKLMFNDASQFIQGTSATVLSIGATDEIDLTATAVDLNGTLNVSGVATFQAAPVFPDGSIAVADLDIDGATDIGAAVVDADLFIVDDGAGGTNRKVTASRIKTYAGFGVGDITGATALTVPPAVTDELVISDAGTLKRIDYEHLAMTPVFWVVKNAAQTISNATQTDLTWQTETLDSNGKFASNVFTPTLAGYYFLQASVLMEYGNSSGEYGDLRIELNDSDTGLDMRNVVSGDMTTSSTLFISGILAMDADDTAKVSIYHTQGANQNVDGNTNYTRFCGFRICGV